VVRIISNDFKTEAVCKIAGEGITADDAYLRPICRCRQRVGHIQKHRLRQFGAQRLTEQRCKPLLGIREILDWD
jgi:hypothetical protein